MTCRSRSSFFRRELAGSYTFSISVLLVLLAVFLDPVHVCWASVQLVRSLCPASFASRIPWPVVETERWCWQTWHECHGDVVHGAERDPLSIREFNVEEFASLRTAPLDIPWIVRGYLNGTRLQGKWTTEWLSQSPGRGDAYVDFFSDARNELIVPDGRGPLRQVLANIAAGGPEKLGTEMVFRRDPGAVSDLSELSLGDKLGAHYFSPAMLGTILTMPIFAARGFETQTARTDLHCEPIANAVLMLEGEKTWTLLAPEYSHLVSPQVSPDGRAYYYTRLAHASPIFKRLPRQEVVTRQGDLLFVPTWTWHRVDYSPGSMAVAVSLFHFRPVDFWVNHPLYAVMIIPNLVKELFGMKQQ